MPASTLDPVNAALRNALSKSSSSNADPSGSLDVQLAGTTKKALLSNIEFEPAGSYQSTVLDKLKSKYIVLKSAEPATPTASKADNMGGEETLTLAKHELFPISAVQLGWNNADWTVGAGMVNMGNTCYLNSTLQALFHVPALVNWLVSDKQHMSECEDSGGYCIICAMRKTLQDSQQRNASSIRPFLIYNKLRLVCRNLIPGRQEDAHEFLRYLVEAMEKSYLGRFKNHQQFDSRTKETTPLNQILGGYLRSAVRCLDCGHVSTTFQHFQDLLLDIRKAQTLEEALDAYFSREQLDDQSYHCESCQKKVPATKQFSLERAPMVLCIQLKRFSVTNNKITKHVQFKQRLELTKYSRNRPNTPLVYRLVALVTHMGPTVGCGHYTAVAQAPCGNFYQFDDSMVRPISHQAVFTTNAYIMLYELEQAPSHVKPVATNGISKSKTLGMKEGDKTNVKIYTTSSAASSSSSSTSATSSKPQTNGTAVNSSSSNNNNGENVKRSAVYGPELPPNKLFKLEDQNGTVTSTLNGHNSSSSSSESDSEQVMAKMVVTAKEVKKSSSSLTRTLSSNSGCSNSTTTNNNSAPSTSTSTSSSSAVSSTTSQLTKLVPYEEDDSSSDDDDEDDAQTKIVTKVTTNGEWKVTSSTDNQPSDGCRKKVVNDRATVNELLKMSTGGYSAPVSTWNGTRAHLDKEIANEKREDRKRAHVDELDQGRVKHVKTSNGGGSFKSNPGYNPFQEYQTNPYRQYYKNGRQRGNNRRFLHRKNNFHNKNNHRFRH